MRLNCLKKHPPFQAPSFLGPAHNEGRLTLFTFTEFFLPGWLEELSFFSSITLYSKSCSCYHPCTGLLLFHACEVVVRYEPIEHILAILSSASLLVFNIMANFSEQDFPSFYSVTLILGSMFTKKNRELITLLRNILKPNPLKIQARILFLFLKAKTNKQKYKME